MIIEYEDDDLYLNGVNVYYIQLNRNNFELNDNINLSGDFEQKCSVYLSGNNLNYNDYIYLREIIDIGRKGDIILFMDFNGKFIDFKKFFIMFVVYKFFLFIIVFVIDFLNKDYFDIFFVIVIYIGINDVEKLFFDVCFEYF